MTRYTVDLNVYGGTALCAEFTNSHDADVYAAELIRLPYVEEVRIMRDTKCMRILENPQFVFSPMVAEVRNVKSEPFFPRLSDWVCFIGTLAMFGVGIAVAYIR